MITPPTTNDELKASFNTATDEKIPHFFVDLPIWENAKPKLKPTVSDLPDFTNPTPLKCIDDLESIIEKLKTKYPNQISHIEGGRLKEMEPNGERGDKLERMPHPFSNTNHIDPGVEDKDKETLRGRITGLRKELERLHEKDGELNKVLYETSPILDRAEGLLPVDPKANPPIESKGMQRLKLNFEWMLCQITALFGQINLALDEKTAPDDPKTVYNQTRRKYIDLMRDLDNHEPLFKDADPGKLGYGRNVKWVYFYPLIHTPDPNTMPARIKGVVIVAKWNPHISSSGIPIAH